MYPDKTEQARQAKGPCPDSQ